MKSKKIIIISIVVAVIAICFAVLASYAFFTARDEIKNTFVMGKVAIELEEPSWDNEKALNFIPGKTYLKDPTLTCLEGPAYARIRLEIKDSDTNTLITDPARIALIKKTIWYDRSYNLSTITTTNLIEGSSYSFQELYDLEEDLSIFSLYNMEDFILDDSRSTINTYIFNYNGVINNNDVSVLFTSIVIPIDFTSSDLALMGNYKLEVFAEAIQSRGFDSAVEAYLELD